MIQQEDWSHVPAVVRAAEVEKVLGISTGTAYAYLKKIRTRLGKRKGQFVSFSEFCEAAGVSMRDAARSLKK